MIEIRLSRARAKKILNSFKFGTFTGLLGSDDVTSMKVKGLISLVQETAKRDKENEELWAEPGFKNTFITMHMLIKPYEIETYLSLHTHTDTHTKTD